MPSPTFAPQLFFDYSPSEHSVLFENSENVWEILPKIDDYIINLFKSGKITANYKDREFVFVDESATVHETAEIEGPAIIGKNCVVSHASYLRDGCILEDGVRIGHASEIKHSVLLNNASAAHLNYIGDSIIGNNVNVSGGAVLANFRLDKKNVMVKVEGEKLETGLEKFGAVIGDGSNIGVNSVLNPGTILGKNCIVYPLQSVTGVYPDNSKIHSS